MTDRNVDILIVGGGLAGASCAEGLREGGFDGSVLLVGREPHPPYERPPCSKDLLRGESSPTRPTCTRTTGTASTTSSCRRARA